VLVRTTRGEAVELVKLNKPRRRKAGSISSSAARVKVIVVVLGLKREGPKMLPPLLVRCIDVETVGCNRSLVGLVSDSDSRLHVVAVMEGVKAFWNDLALFLLTTERWLRELTHSTRWMAAMVTKFVKGVNR